MKTTEKSVPVGWGGGTLLGEGRLPVGFPANSTVDQVQFKVVAPSDTGRERKGNFFPCLRNITLIFLLAFAAVPS